MAKQFGEKQCQTMPLSQQWRRDPRSWLPASGKKITTQPPTSKISIGMDRRVGSCSGWQGTSWDTHLSVLKKGSPRQTRRAGHSTQEKYQTHFVKNNRGSIFLSIFDDGEHLYAWSPLILDLHGGQKRVLPDRKTWGENIFKYLHACVHLLIPQTFYWTPALYQSLCTYLECRGGECVMQMFQICRQQIAWRCILLNQYIF